MYNKLSDGGHKFKKIYFAVRVRKTIENFAQVVLIISGNIFYHIQKCYHSDNVKNLLILNTLFKKKYYQTFPI